jgi:hypothetical protein
MRRNRAAATALPPVACAVLVLALGSTDAFADGKRRYVPVEVEANFDGQDPGRTKRLRPALERAAREALQLRHDVEVVDRSDVAIVFYVRSLEEGAKAKSDPAVIDYGVRIEVRVDGERAGDKVVPCAEKGEAELVDCAVDGIPAILTHVPTEELPPEPSPPPPSESDTSPQPHAERVPPIRGWGIAGIVLAAGGVATTIAGAVYLARGEVTEHPNLIGRNEVTDYRVPGRALLGAGLSVLVVGTVMIAADVAVQAKKRKRTTARIELDAGPGFAGARLRARF